MEHVRRQVAELKARLEEIRVEQRRLRRHVQFKKVSSKLKLCPKNFKWQENQKAISEVLLEEQLADIAELQCSSTPEGWVITCSATSTVVYD